MGSAGAGLLAAFLFTVVASHAPAATPLKVGMDTRSRPWAFVPGLDYTKEDWIEAPKITRSQIAQLQGVDIEVLKALSRRLDVTPEIVPSAWAGIDQALLAKRFDIILNAWGPNSKTPPGIIASSPYYNWGLVVAVRARDMRIKSYRDLGGMKVGYFRDLIVDRSVRNLGAAQLIPLDDSDQLFDKLAEGGIDAAVEDSTYVRWRVAHDSAFRAVGDPLNRLGYHIGLRRADTDLYRRVEAAIRDFVGSDEAAQIRGRWEGAATPGPD
jgi:ABC-type amino acid transport substrate-binding protein